MTDRQKGILSSLDSVMPTTKVRFCARHILVDIKTKVNGVLLGGSEGYH